MAGTATDLERELAELLERERFSPPEEFRRDALIKDMSVHEEAARDPVAWWAQQAKALHWFAEPQTVLDDGDVPFFKWFEGGKINASYNCLDRHVEAGLGDRVAFHWHGEHHIDPMGRGRRPLREAPWGEERGFPWRPPRPSLSASLARGATRPPAPTR